MQITGNVSSRTRVPTTTHSSYLPCPLSDTKSQYARDDPAFLVLLIISLCREWMIYSLIHVPINHIESLPVSAFAISIVTHGSPGDRLYLLLYVVFVDFLLVGVIVATLMWLLVNRVFRANQFEQDVEWAYAFDIHINAFFPPSLLLHFFQLFFYNGKRLDTSNGSSVIHLKSACSYYQTSVFRVAAVWKWLLVPGPELLRVHQLPRLQW